MSIWPDRSMALETRGHRLSASDEIMVVQVEPSGGRAPRSGRDGIKLARWCRWLCGDESRRVSDWVG